jgi:hypothetical protein
MRKYFVIKSFSTSAFKWAYLKRADDDGIIFNEDVRWAKFYHSEDDARINLMQLPQDKDNYYSIEAVYHKF